MFSSPRFNKKGETIKREEGFGAVQVNVQTGEKNTEKGSPLEEDSNQQ
jgi:hypothetical protein